MASSSEALDYDPKTDPARKAKSNDLGIKRFKQHLIDGYEDIVLCLKVTTEIREEMEAYLQKKRRRPLFLDGIEEENGEDEVVEVATADVQAGADGGATPKSAAKKPSSRTAAKRRHATYQLKASRPSNGNSTPKTPKSVVAMLRRTPKQIVVQRRAKDFQPTIESSTRTKEEKQYVDLQWALWFMECGVPFNAANSRQFEIAYEATTQYGSGYKPPTNQQLGEPLLQECVKVTSAMRKDHEQAWKQYGCTLMSDGWTDMRVRHLINFLVNSPEGMYFLESVDASSQVHSATMLTDLLQEKIKDIGKDNVVQVVTNNGANYNVAGKILMDRIPTLFWSPCAAHCLDLMLEEIRNLKTFKKPIACARCVTTFNYRHGSLLSAMRAQTGGTDLVRAAKTRFAISFLTLKSLYKNKDALKSFFVSEAWIGNNLCTTIAGQQVQDFVLSIEFWNLVEDCLRASAPLLIVLRAVDGDEKPAMPEGLLKRIMDIIEKRWVNQMEHPLYGAALYLNPGNFFLLVKANDDATVGQLRGCFVEVLGRMHVDEATGATQALQGRNLPRRATATQHYSRSRNVHVPATEDGEEEDEVEDPHDDAEVSECEEDDNVPATEEDKAADPDEFDDGF
ncbi:unnamed protein product [Miscanthus lutarioriparius]|uniref:DUF659 domain-containing protein n=1 Tax=Miscanthus lutarioriparius TaxID=422564 RepID=A0A811QPR3_9POAL|nr:unnamed protein product [Miscanthus lutarioriparius]